jgi:hypothetical protein
VEEKLSWFEFVVVVFYLGLFVVDLGCNFLITSCNFMMDF